MRHGYDEPPINALPPVIWALALPIIASEIVFGLGNAGMVGGGGGIGLRSRALEIADYRPEMALQFWDRGSIAWGQVYRILSYPFIHFSFTHAAFVAVFVLALGKVLAESFRPAAVLGLFFGSSVVAALIYSVIAGLVPGIRFNPLVGGYPAVYGFVGAFTFLLWTRLGQTGGNRMRAFSLIGMLLAFQLVFGLLFGGGGTAWIAEVLGFASGFTLSFLLVPGGPARVARSLRQR